jgi:hypothetical protein
MSVRHRFVDGPGGWFLTLGLAVGLVLALMRPASAAEMEGKWYDSFWPLGDRVDVHTLSEEYIPFKSVGEIPGRPALLLELGDPFLDTGKLYEGFKVPLIGAVWQPRLWSYLINRTAFQSFDDSTASRKRDTEIANRMDLYVNLQLTGTEKILLGLRPFDNNLPGRFTRYTFNGTGTDDQFKNELNFDIETLFFEGDVGSLFPNLDRAGIKPIDFGFTVGRQPITFQEGIIINDTVDAVGFVRNNLVFPNTSNLRISGMWAWDRLDRNDRSRSSDANMYALFAFADADVSSYNLDMIYVDDNANDGGGDALYIGASAIQRIRAWGGISTAFRVNSSIALDDEIAGNVVGNGSLITAEFSALVPGSEDIIYFNPYVSIGNYTQAGREAIVGGPLANTGILFASPNLSTYGAEISPFTDDVLGFAAGYQAFWDHTRRNLILEVAAKHDYDGDAFDSYGIGFQLQQAIGQNFQAQLEAFHAINTDNRNDNTGARVELLIVY